MRVHQKHKCNNCGAPSHKHVNGYCFYCKSSISPISNAYDYIKTMKIIDDRRKLKKAK
jgi:predicted ATP-dependent serine protease